MQATPNTRPYPRNKLVEKGPRDSLKGPMSLLKNPTRTSPQRARNPSAQAQKFPYTKSILLYDLLSTSTCPTITMPKPTSDAKARSGDARFAALTNDPRYRLPSAKNARVAVDKRFNRMFKEGDQDFNRRSKVDKYGRRIEKGKGGEQKRLERLYRAEDEDEDEESSEEEGNEEDEEVGRAGKLVGKTKGKAKVVGDSGSESEVDVDEDIEAELRRVEKKYDPARDGGFESSSEESSSEDEEDVEEAELPEEGEEAQVPMGEVSKRLAVVNLDWDNIRAQDIMAVAKSFVPADGRIDSVTIYPSEFGKERLEREELEGPPKEIFAASKSRAHDSDEDEEGEPADEDDIRKKLQSGDTGEEFDSAALRRYQLDRLRYFYAVLTCSDEGTAESIYKALDGREYLTSANFFDLRFIPDEVAFDEDKPREECTTLPSGYKPNEFVTEALTHSKVKLTWDADDATRKEVQKRAFSRNEIDENDLRAYIGGDSESEEEETGEVDGTVSKKEAERQRMRALLGLAGEKKASRGEKPVGDMQITFTSGLSAGREGRDGVFENSPPRDETTRERYIRKEKERKAKRRERAKAKRDGTEEAADDDKADTSGSDSEAGSEIVVVDRAGGVAAGDEAADPFDDPFFNTTEAPSKSQKEKTMKQERIKKREAKRLQEEKDEAKRRELEALMEEGNDDKMKHFDMKEIQKAAKKKGKKDRKGKKDVVAEDADAIVDDAVETSDPRFARLFESHEYAIDPTNPRFQKTEGMQKLLEEGRKRRRNDNGASDESKVKKSRRDDGGGADDTQKLLARVKAKSKVKSSR
ncbi:Pre-rRNA-processing protein esf1 [Sphaceloma murrayae]|uniref:Pre-rRNA-processing protein esf1 n=1 Tax=Sphaceloma murrayae TaxID=2082308 RepID=A0A2K1QMH3_9PEZI|nr:Pre-rRNA-processing protein esf1 [Sphaceloma murrayae]